jgi:hypothetical protein
MEYQQYQQYRPSHYPGQPHIPVRQKRVTLGGHFKNQWNNSRGFFKQWWGQKTDRQPEQPNNSYYPTQTGSGISRPRKRRQKHYQYGGLINPNLIRDLTRIGKIAKKTYPKSRKKQSGGAFGMPSYAGKFIKLGKKYGGRKKKAGGTKQSGGGMGNLTRQTPRKQLNNVPTQFQYHQ